MFSHVMLGCRDIKRSSAFYDALLAPIGLIPCTENDSTLPFACWVDPGNTTGKFFICLPLNDADATAGNGVMVAFNAPSADSVDTAYNAAISLGGTDEGPPGPRPQYGDHYYGAYVRDLDGNKVHVVHHGAD